MKVLYLAATSKRNNRENPTGKTNSWKAILKALNVHYGGRNAENIRLQPSRRFTLCY